MEYCVKFCVNGEPVELTVSGSQTLLNVLREQLQLTGAKYGCGIAQCGACTVHLDGKPVRSCLLPIKAAEPEAATAVCKPWEGGAVELAVGEVLLDRRQAEDHRLLQPLLELADHRFDLPHGVAMGGLALGAGHRHAPPRARRAEERIPRHGDDDHEAPSRARRAANLDPRDAELFEKTLQLLKGLPELGVLLQAEKDLPRLTREIYVGKNTEIGRAH